MKPICAAIRSHRCQTGAALLIMLFVMVFGTLALLLHSLRNTKLQNVRTQKNVQVLAIAKEGLIAYATSIALTPTGSKKPGTLPCPDTNNDGIAETSCGNASGSTGQSLRLGRLPWKTLQLPDLRDNSGERLWYAVSSNFKNNTAVSTLNSDTLGSITIRDSAGNISQNGCLAYSPPQCPYPVSSDAPYGSGAVAVIIAPGAPLVRQPSGTPQDRSASGANAAGNFLDATNINGMTHDNQSFSDFSSINGFIQGGATDTDNNPLNNDQLLAITQEQLMSAVQQRVAAELKQCLNEYATVNGNNGRYPWAANAATVSYPDASGILFGRIPDTPFDNTVADSGGQMINTWLGNCNINSNSGWWLNWKELVFYALSDAYKPNAPAQPAGCGTCIHINSGTQSNPAQFIVIVAGRRLTGQVRVSLSDKGKTSNYLEAGNQSASQSGNYTFTRQPYTSTFNDTVVYQP